MANLKETLKKHNVTLVNKECTLLQCNNCHQTWPLTTQPGERLLKGYWKCPRKCNYQEKEYKYSPDVRAYFAQRNREQNKKRGLTVE